jgi:NADPH:quinone reductase-like Zn-dependent oxidoreductase
MYLIGRFNPGKTILWHAGASSVSISGIQLSLGDSASAVFATTRSDEKASFCNTKKTDWVDEGLKATDGKGVDVIVDFIGPETFAGNLRAVAKDGTIVSLATLSGPVMQKEMEMPNMVLFFAKRIRYEGSGLRSRDEEYQGKLRDQLVEHALPKFKDGSFKVFVEKVFPWEKIQEAHAQMERNETKGKLICTIG